MKRFTIGTFANFCHVVVDGRRADSAGNKTARLAPLIRGALRCSVASAVDCPNEAVRVCAVTDCAKGEGAIGANGSWRIVVAVAEEAVTDGDCPGVWFCRVAEERCDGDAVALATAAAVASIASSFVGPLPLYGSA